MEQLNRYQQPYTTTVQPTDSGPAPMAKSHPCTAVLKKTDSHPARSGPFIASRSTQPVTISPQLSPASSIDSFGEGTSPPSDTDSGYGRSSDGAYERQPSTDSDTSLSSAGSTSTGYSCKKSNLWFGSTEAMQRKLTAMSTRELAELGSKTFAEAPPSSRHLAVYYREVTKRLNLDRGISADWLVKVLTPLRSSHFHNDELFYAITEKMEQLNREKYFTPAEIISLARAMDTMVNAGFIHPFFPCITSMYANTLTHVTLHNLTSMLHIMRATAMLHSQIPNSARDKTNTANDLKEMMKNLKQFLARRSPELSPEQRNMVHWLALYCHHVLKVPGPAPRLAMTEQPECTVSQFQKDVEELLMEKLPQKNFQREYILPITGLSADIYCEPGIVIEVDGKKFHHSFELLLEGSCSAHHYKTSRERGKTILKRKILKAAGYQVINISDTRSSSIQRIVSAIRHTGSVHAGQTNRHSIR